MRASWPRKRLTSHGTLLKCGKWLRSARPNFPGAHFMKNVYEVLRQKEMELTRLEKEVEALRLVAPLLSEEKELGAEVTKTALPTVAAAQPVRAAGWDDTAKRWP